MFLTHLILLRHAQTPTAMATFRCHPTINSITALPVDSPCKTCLQTWQPRKWASCLECPGLMVQMLRMVTARVLFDAAEDGSTVDRTHTTRITETIGATATCPA